MKTVVLRTNNLRVVDVLVNKTGWNTGWELDGDTHMVSCRVKGGPLSLWVLKMLWNLLNKLGSVDPNRVVWR